MSEEDIIVQRALKMSMRTVFVLMIICLGCGAVLALKWGLLVEAVECAALALFGLWKIPNWWKK